MNKVEAACPNCLTDTGRPKVFEVTNNSFHCPNCGKNVVDGWEKKFATRDDKKTKFNLLHKLNFSKN